MIKLVDITKSYGKQEILKNVSFLFEKGKTYLITGPNGSGKSTLLKIVLGLVKPTSGKIIRTDAKIAYIPEKGLFPGFLRVDEFLYGLLAMDGVKTHFKKVDALISDWELDPKKRLINLSKGNLQKVSIVQALILDTNVYIFDEALNGLDKAMQNKFLDYIKRLKSSDSIILISTHYEKYFTKVCDIRLKLEEGSLKICEL